MTPQETLEQVKIAFTYVSDPDKDRWTLPPIHNPFEGDCEEFALAVLLRHAESESAMFAMLNDGTAKIERVLTDRGVGHAVLWLKDWGYVDSIHQFWREKRLFEHVQTFSANDVRRKLDGKKVKGPANKKMIALAAVLAVAAAVMLMGDMG